MLCKFLIIISFVCRKIKKKVDERHHGSYPVPPNTVIQTDPVNLMRRSCLLGVAGNIKLY